MPLIIEIFYYLYMVRKVRQYLVSWGYVLWVGIGWSGILG